MLVTMLAEEMASSPDNECTDGACNGNFVCALDVGQACTQASDCLGGHCVDGFCCDTACDQNCEACSAAKTGGTDGTCNYVTIATDPDNECSDGACDGAGVCIADDGQTCSAGSDCLSGFCVDGPPGERRVLGRAMSPLEEVARIDHPLAIFGRAQPARLPVPPLHATC